MVVIFQCFRWCRFRLWFWRFINPAVIIVSGVTVGWFWSFIGGLRLVVKVQVVIITPADAIVYSGIRHLGLLILICFVIEVQVVIIAPADAIVYSGIRRLGLLILICFVIEVQVVIIVPTVLYRFVDIF